jgi:hypothetical protein
MTRGFVRRHVSLAIIYLCSAKVLYYVHSMSEPACQPAKDLTEVPKQTRTDLEEYVPEPSFRRTYPLLLLTEVPQATAV